MDPFGDGLEESATAINILGNRKREILGRNRDELLPKVSKRARPNRDSDHGDDLRQTQLSTKRLLSHDDYTVGWICALPIEMAAASSMLDRAHQGLPGYSDDSNTYTLGNIGTHNIAITCLPSGQHGNNNSATVANNMQRSFPSMRHYMMVGIGGGVPGDIDLRLGDIVVSNEVIQYDFGKTVQNGHFERTGVRNRPSQDIMTAVSGLRARHESVGSQIPFILTHMLEQNPLMMEYARPLPKDKLFQSTYDHLKPLSSCDGCDSSRQVKRPARVDTNPKIHYGVIASGNQVMRDAGTRDRLGKELDVLCFEMEAAGLMAAFPCLVIRGICDYADSHKCKQWQKYAAAAAAAYAKELLSVIPQRKPPITFMTTYDKEQSKSRARRNRLLNSLGFHHSYSPLVNIEIQYYDACQWFLANPEYMDWLNPERIHQHHGLLWIHGKPGAGKSTLMKFMYTHAKENIDDAAIIAFFFNARGIDLERSATGMYKSLVVQLFQKLPDLQEALDDPIYNINPAPQDQSDCYVWTVDLLQTLFTQVITKLGERRLLCFVDGLDECDESQVVTMAYYIESLLENAVNLGSKVHICFSSRHYPCIDMRIGRKVTLENQTGHEKDLERYVRSNLRSREGKDGENIVAGILQKAAGVFMWVVVVIKMLNSEIRRGRIFALQRKLDETPTELSNLFKSMLQKDRENMEDFLLCVQWILYARRPLKCEEFYLAIISGLNVPDSANWNLELVGLDDLHRFVLSSSKGLAEVTKFNTVQFIHESVRDFLIKENGLTHLHLELGENFRCLSHDRMKRCCQLYISAAISDNQPLNDLKHIPYDNTRSYISKIFAKLPFLAYATRHILYHADEASDGFPQDEFMREFPLEIWIQLHNAIVEYPDCLYSPNQNLLYILARKGLARLIEIYLRKDMDIDSHGEIGEQSPLFVALSHGHRDAFVALLRHDKLVLEEDDITAALKYGREFINGNSQTPLLWALERKHLHLAKLIIASRQYDLDVKDHSGRTALLLASKHGWSAIVELLLAKNVDANLRDNSGQTPIFIATLFGHTDIVSLLLKTEGVNTEPRDRNLQTPLHVAASFGREVIFKLLMATGIIDINSMDVFGKTPLYCAAEKGHKAILELLLAANDVDVNARDVNDESPLFMATRNGHESVLRLLLVSEGIRTDLVDKQGQTILHIAVSRGHEAIVQLLLARHVNSANAMDAYKRTPLHLAASNNREAIAKLLVEAGADKHAKDRNRQTALHVAAFFGHDFIVRLLLENDQGISNFVDTRGQTPLHMATLRGNTSVATYLIEAHAENNAQTSDGSTPLHIAALHGYNSIIECLLRTEGLDPNPVDLHGRTPLHFAARKGNAGIAILLIGGGAEKDAEDRNGQTPLHWAIFHEHSYMASLLMQMDADKDARDNGGNTPLHLAASTTAGSIATTLIEADVDINVRNAEHHTPLHTAALNGNADVAGVLIKANADKEAKDGVGQTPLCTAALHGHLSVFKVLYLAGANKRVIDIHGQTPLQMAECGGHNDIVDFLRSGI